MERNIFIPSVFHIIPDCGLSFFCFFFEGMIQVTESFFFVCASTLIL